jgi:hypothetical protein
MTTYSTPKGGPIGPKKVRNQALPCSVPGCSLQRKAVAKYCAPHEQRRYRYGSPLGRQIKPREYERERSETAAVIERNAHDHPGLVYALERLAGLLEGREGARLGNRKDSLQRHLARLKGHAVTPEQVLTEASALWLYGHHRNPTVLPQAPQLEAALGQAVLRLAPFNPKTAWSTSGKTYHVTALPADRKALGRWLRTTLGPLLVNIATAIEAEEANRRSMTDALRVALKPAPTS